MDEIIASIFRLFPRFSFIFIMKLSFHNTVALIFIILTLFCSRDLMFVLM